MSWIFTAPMGLWAMGSLVGVIAIYLFYQQTKPRVVSGLFLWSSRTRQIKSGRRRQIPPYSRSLLLDFLAVLLLSLAMAGPAWISHDHVRCVIVLDGSLSMQAGDNHRRAVELARKIADDASHTPMLFVHQNDLLTLRVPEGQPRTIFDEALARYAPFGVTGAGDLATVRRVVSGPLEIHVITDNKHDTPLPPNTRLVQHVLGTEGRNPAFLAARRTRNSSGIDQLLFTVATDGTTVTLKIQTGEQSLHRHTFAPGQQAPQVVSLDLPDGTAAIRATLESVNDVLAADSEVHLLPPPDRSVGFAVECSNAKVRRWVTMALRSAGGKPQHTSPQLIVSQGSLSAMPDPSGDAFHLILPTASRGSKSVFTGPYIVDFASSYCRDLSLDGVYWTCVESDAKSLNPLQTLIHLDRLPLYYLHSPSQLVLNVDLTRSNLPMQTAWPVLMANLVDTVSYRKPGFRRVNYDLHELLEYQPSIAEGYETSYRLRSADAESVPIGHPGASRVPSRPGPYQFIMTAQESPPEITALVVNAIAPEESNLSTRATADHTETMFPRSTDAEHLAPHSVAWILVLSAMGLLIANYFFEQRGA
jgi:hypothetical protein